MVVARVTERSSEALSTLCSLAMLSIENELWRKTALLDVICDFANEKIHKGYISTLVPILLHPYYC